MYPGACAAGKILFISLPLAASGHIKIYLLKLSLLKKYILYVYSILTALVLIFVMESQQYYNIPDIYIILHVMSR